MAVVAVNAGVVCSVESIGSSYLNTNRLVYCASPYLPLSSYNITDGAQGSGKSLPSVVHSYM